MTDTYRLEDRFLADSGTVFMTGIQALARIPLEQLRADRRAGLRTAAFVSGYQGSPLGGLGAAVEAAARLEPDLPVRFRPGMNEEYAATAVMGSQLAAARPDPVYEGVVGIWYGKAPGVDRAADALRHGVFAGASMKGGVLAVVGDDPAAKSSTVPSSSAGLLADMHMPLLYPGDPGEALDLGRHGIAMSRATGLWSALKIVADVADATAAVNLHPERIQPVLPLHEGRPYLHRPDGGLLTPHTLEIEREIIEVRYELARTYAADNKLNHVTVDPPDAWVGIVSSGITYREVREALARLGLDDDSAVAGAGIRLLKMGMPMPFNPTTVRIFARGLQQVVVIEEKHANIESLLKDALYPMPDRPVVVGKADEDGRPLFPGWGALDADTLVPLLRRRLESRLGDRLVPERRERSRIPLSPVPGGVTRSPFFCSGCPHNRSTRVPEGAMVGAGIGCHTMTLLMDSDRVGDIAGITCMGNEGTQWIGMSDFVRTDHMFQNLGDGTYFHSGQLAVQAAVAAGVNITYKLLFNGTVAMTGGQHPEGQLEIARVVDMLKAEGVAAIIVTTDDVHRHRRELPGSVKVWDRDRIMEAQELLAATPGVTVLIHDQPCAAELRRARKRGLVETPNQRVVINQRICEGCGDCGDVSNCLSVQPVDTPFGRKTHIDQTTCNLDFSCLEGDCPSFMTVTTGEPGLLSRLLGRGRKGGRGNTPEEAPTVRVPAPPEVPEPELLVPDTEFAMRITGIGGTGVVTVSQVLGTAAMLAGYQVRGLDQIGLSQKAGPVVSDVRLSRRGPTFTNRLGEAQADLLLAFDQLVAASPRGLLTCRGDRTVVVGSTSATPTGAMITHPDLHLPLPEELAERIGERTRPEHFWADAQAVTEDLFGSTTTANFFVVGMAVQAGALPIDPAHLEQAIELNGVAVEANIAAFRWGRAQIAAPEAVARARREANPAPEVVEPEHFPDRLDRLESSPELRAQLSMLAGELVRWGDESTAEAWFDTLDRVHRAERAVDPTGSHLLRAVAEGLFKLTAYKDEYEVARLMLDEAATAEARHVAGPGGSIAWKLHPPMLRALGLRHKITVGSWATPAARALANGKRLRGTAADPFGRARVRRIERQLPAEYSAALDRALSHLTAENLDRVVELARTPDIVRGYEDIKLANVEKFRRRLEELSGEIEADVV